MFDAIVLAGGTARRLQGVDKPGLEVGGISLLDRVLAAVGDASRTVVVGPPRPVSRPVTWCREDPVGGGPVAAIAAAMPVVTADVVVVLAADLPAVAPAVPVLLAALAGSSAGLACLVQDGARVNYLAAAWRVAALRAAIAAMADTNGASVRALVAGADLIGVPDAEGWGRDCDTWDDLADARQRLDADHPNHSTQ